MLFYGRLLNALPLLPILGPPKLNQVTLKAPIFPAIFVTPRRSPPKEHPEGAPEGAFQDTLLVKKTGSLWRLPDLETRKL